MALLALVWHLMWSFFISLQTIFAHGGQDVSILYNLTAMAPSTGWPRDYSSTVLVRVSAAKTITRRPYWTCLTNLFMNIHVQLLSTLVFL